MCDDGTAMEVGKSLSVGHCADHGTVTIIGYRKNGERIGFQLSASDMADYIDLLQSATCQAVNLPPDYGRELDPETIN